jgi:hypothetical protein
MLSKFTEDGISLKLDLTQSGHLRDNQKTNMLKQTKDKLFNTHKTFHTTQMLYTHSVMPILPQINLVTSGTQYGEKVYIKKILFKKNNLLNVKNNKILLHIFFNKLKNQKSNY